MPLEKPYKSSYKLYKPEYDNNTGLYFIEAGVSAGFPSPAMDFMEYKIDLNKHLAGNPHTTYYVKVAGNSMINAGIEDKDILVADRSLEPANGKIAICLIDGEFTVKRLKKQDNILYLMPENPAYSPMLVTELNQFVVWGIVLYVIKRVG